MPLITEVTYNRWVVTELHAAVRSSAKRDGGCYSLTPVAVVTMQLLTSRESTGPRADQ